MIINAKSPEDTKKLGKEIAAFLRPGDLLCLNGNLGTGKTMFSKGIGQGLGIAEELITSPTYTLINEYKGKYSLYHFDVYRLDDPGDLEDVGYEDYFYGNGITLVEWGNQVRHYLPEDYLEIIIEKIDMDNRTLEFIAHGDRGAELLNQIVKVVQE